MTNPTPSLFGAKATDDYTELKAFLASFANIKHVQHSPSGELYRVKLVGGQSVLLDEIDPVTGDDVARKVDPFRRPQVGSLWFLRDCVSVDFVPAEEAKRVK